MNDFCFEIVYKVDSEMRLWSEPGVRLGLPAAVEAVDAVTAEILLILPFRSGPSAAAAAAAEPQPHTRLWLWFVFFRTACAIALYS